MNNPNSDQNNLIRVLKNEADNLLQYATERDLVCLYNDPSKLEEFIKNLNGVRDFEAKIEKAHENLIMLAKNLSFKEEYDKNFEKDIELVQSYNKLVTDNKQLHNNNSVSDLLDKFESSLVEISEKTENLESGIKRKDIRLNQFVEDFSNEREKYHRVKALKELLENK
ncbi:hypothetical protein MHBO_003332 [Bonamia ostreae]|uniref:VPS37 C-terminal domain-containing protein n=1 Tax=Bonamia ostreae TaxID=126728 RepID=A0ABV2AQ37_9EUKA